MLKRNLFAIAIAILALVLTTTAYGQKTKVTKNQKTNRQQTFVPSQAANAGTYGWQRDLRTRFPQATQTNTNRNRICPSPMCGGNTNPTTQTNNDRYANIEISYVRGTGEVAMESVDLVRSANVPFDRGYLQPAVTNRGTVTQMVFEPNNEPLWVKGRK